MVAPVVLRPDNFTPPARTPWGGTRLLERYKPAFASAHPIVGESWEVSVEPTFPSVTASGETLEATIAKDPRAWLGEASARRHGGQTPLLVKLLDAAEPLSVQVHPHDDDPALAADESGKPEAWVVLDAEPGAGLFLGFQEGVAKDDVARVLAAGGRVDALMNFVPVAVGDAYVIDAGTAHAIGAGVTLVEPQLVRPGRRGLTYRFWDWDRRYDDAGRPSPDGAPRPLHVERSLAVTRWDLPGGQAFVDRCRARQRRLSTGAVTRVEVVSWPWFVVERWSGAGRLTVPEAEAMWALTCVAGRVLVETSRGTVSFGCGESAVVPAAVGAFEVSLDAGDVFAVRA
ncbi:MAG: class I mannose-6-phosphate isomerase [Deltaproteobacteria bacterium]|nr:class I mannose-6-phosphate isomerase [Deltaproteobacteria bacterium]